MVIVIPRAITKKITQPHKGNLQNPINKIILNGERLSTSLVTRQGCTVLPLLFNIALGVLARAWGNKEKEKNPDSKRSENISICRHDLVPRKS